MPSRKVNRSTGQQTTSGGLQDNPDILVLEGPAGSNRRSFILMEEKSKIKRRAQVVLESPGRPGESRWPWRVQLVLTYKEHRRRNSTNPFFWVQTKKNLKHGFKTNLVITTKRQSRDENNFIK